MKYVSNWPIRVAKIVGMTVLAVAANLVPFILGMVLSGPLSFGDNQIIGKLLGTAIGIALAIVIAVAINRYVVRGGLPSLREEARVLAGQWWIWLLVSAAVPLVVMAIYLLSGSATVHWYQEVPWYLALLTSVTVALAPGVIEELAYRYLLLGYLLTKMGTIPAILLSGLVFALLHANKIDSAAELLPLMIGGIAVTALFAGVYLRSGSIWAAALVHIGWDMIRLNTGFSLTNAFEAKDKGYFRYFGMSVEPGPTFWTGGSFGVETALPTVAVYMIVALACLWPVLSKQKDQGGIAQVK